MEDEALSARYLSDFVKFDEKEFNIEEYEKKLSTFEQLLSKSKEQKSTKIEKDFCTHLKKYIDQYKVFDSSNTDHV
jgi:hypothetical protein